jgi:tol-pal system protein YbgF
MYKAVLFLVSLIFCCNTFAQPKENRVALVMGNSAYKTAPLKNPTNDAKDMAAKLKGMGFTVVERSNLTSKQIGSTLREFRSKLSPGSVALVYYAGHGLQIKGENYFPTVDAEIAGEEDVPNQSLAMRQIMDVLEDAKTRLNLVFLDACRNNPYQRSFRSSSDGLSKVVAPSGTLISFATRPGSVAADGTGRNGLYTGALLEAMDSRGDQIEQVLKRVVTRVKAGSKNQQEPWMEGSIEGEFCFGNCLVTVAQTGVSDERALWDSVKDSRDVNEIRAYLEKFPRGLFAGVARAKILSLEKTEQQIALSRPTQQSSFVSVPVTQSQIIPHQLQANPTKSSVFSERYAYRLIGRIKPNINFPADIAGNPRVKVQLRVAPDGTITSRRILESSGYKAWDDAVLRAIDKTEILPKDTDGRVPPLMVFGFGPLDAWGGTFENNLTLAPNAQFIDPQAEFESAALVSQSPVPELVPATIDGKEVMVDPDEKLDYDKAMALFRQADFAAAQGALESFVLRHGASAYVPLALFWLGHAQYANKAYKESMGNFHKLLRIAPKHPRAAESMLAISNVQIELKDMVSARSTLKNLIVAYPRSDVAVTARERLNRLQ